MGKTYWMLATTAENFDISRRGGFATQGIETSQRRKAVRMSAGDRILYYLRDLRVFAATGTLTSGYFEDHSRVWKHHRNDETFPHRVRLRADIVLEKERFLDARQIGPRMEYVKRWPPEDWSLAFMAPLHIIPQKDFALIEEEMRRARSRKRRRRSGRRRSSRRGRSRGDVPAAAGAQTRRAVADRAVADAPDPPRGAESDRAANASVATAPDPSPE